MRCEGSWYPNTRARADHVFMILAGLRVGKGRHGLSTASGVGAGRCPRALVIRACAAKRLEVGSTSVGTVRGGAVVEIENRPLQLFMCLG